MIPRTRIGGLEVSRMGLGAMVLTTSYAAPDVGESRATFERALELGVTFIDTADAYGAGENEVFVGRLLAGRRHEVELASKFGLVPGTGGVDGRPSYVRACIDASLQRLGTDHLDLYYQHRVDPDVPLEETVGAMAELVTAGKVLHLGLCEVSAEQLRAACAVHPITALQSEWSLWARQIEGSVLPAARQLGVGVVPYSPLGRGFLAGAVRSAAVLADGDLRGADPRLQGDRLQRNLALVAALEELGAAKGATPAQLALAWLLAQGDDVAPIPGMERRAFLDQNLGALDVVLDAGDRAALDRAFAPGAAAGNPDATLLREGVALVRPDPE